MLIRLVCRARTEQRVVVNVPAKASGLQNNISLLPFVKLSSVNLITTVITLKSKRMKIKNYINDHLYASASKVRK